MKTTIPVQRVNEPAGAPTGRRRRGIVRWALTGFGVGGVSASAYLLMGGDYFLFIPRSAFIVFYPGFSVGNAAYKWGLSPEASKVLGVLAVGFVYAVLATVARLGWFARKHRRQSPALRQDSR